MGSTTLYMAKKELDHVLGGGDYTRPATLYAVLLTVRPTMADTGSTITEADYTGYAREAITNNSTNFPAATDLSQTPLTSGALEVGQRYVIDAFNAGDDFTNVGATSNASGVEFVAIGTTPTAWTEASELLRMGAYKTNGVDFEFDECTAGSSTIGWVGIVDADAAGNLMYIATLQNSKEITAGDKPRFPASSLKFYRS